MSNSLGIRSMHRRLPVLVICIVVSLMTFGRASSQDATPEEAVQSRNDFEFRQYLSVETKKLSERCLSDTHSLQHWKKERPGRRRELLEMLGLDPLPSKTELKATVTGTIDGEGFDVRMVHFQSRPGLYVTGNLYVPDEVEEKLPAILYLCGHGAVKKNGISYGNKVHYHHHGVWFAKNGFVCLIIDSLQLGEIEGIHHGTHHLNSWWWLNRGYTPAGVEAWNCVRAIDYLETLPEIDTERIGVTGRSGGGAYSWWIAAIDQRIKVAVPVAGITDLTNYVVDDCIEGHCDCMFMVNTYRWDYPMLAAMVAPRPLLISNTDRDPIFPVDGVYRTYRKVRDVYEMDGKGDNIGLHITSGPHQDTQELRVHAFQWFNQHLKGTQDLIRIPAEKTFDPEQLKVFRSLPADSINAKIHDSFVQRIATPPVPADAKQWETLQTKVLRELTVKTFGGWPRIPIDLNLTRIKHSVLDGQSDDEYEFDSQIGVRLSFRLVRPVETKESSPVRVEIRGTTEFESTPDGAIHVMFRPRGFGGPDAVWKNAGQIPIHVRRRYNLLGQTIDGMRIYDIRRMLAAVAQVMDNEQAEFELASAEPTIGAMCTFAALFEDNVAKLTVPELVDWDAHGPYLLNIDRVTTAPILAAIVGNKTEIHIQVVNDEAEANERWAFPRKLDQKLNRQSFFVERLR